MLGTPDQPVDEEQWFAAGKLAFERGLHPQGSVRHTLAQLGARDLRPQLAAKIVADTIPGARFLLLPGVGHELPRSVWPNVLQNLDENLAACRE